MAYDAVRGRVVVFGGFTGLLSVDTWEYDGINWFEAQPATAPAARLYHAMTYDAARSRIVLFGGWDGTARFADTWTFQYDSPCPREACIPGVDDDGDGLAGCADPDCERHPTCL